MRTEHHSLAGRPLSTPMRWIWRVATLLVLVAGAPLILLPDRTAELFVFPIDPPVTAAFIGANYWAAVVVAGLSSARRAWIGARAALPGVVAFTALTGAISIINIGQFDTASIFTWIWLGVYVLFPLAAIGAWLHHRRIDGEGDPPPAGLPVLLRTMLGTGAAILLSAGLALMVYPGQAGPLWPWPLTTPNAAYRTAGGTSVEPYVGCWLVGLGLVIGGALLENDAQRARPVFGGLVALLVLQVVTLLRFGASATWDTLSGLVFGAVMILIGGIGCWGLAIRGKPTKRPAASARRAAT